MEGEVLLFWYFIDMARGARGSASKTPVRASEWKDVTREEICKFPTIHWGRVETGAIFVIVTEGVLVWPRLKTSA